MLDRIRAGRPNKGALRTPSLFLMATIHPKSSRFAGAPGALASTARFLALPVALASLSCDPGVTADRAPGDAAAATAGAGVQAAEAAFDDTIRARVEAEVDSATRAFEAAERARDAEAAVAHLAPDFSIFADGQRVSYEESVAGIRATLPTHRHFEPGWEDLRVRALSPTLAISSFTFNDSIVDSEGALKMARGPTTLVWERRGGRWLIIYGDADHYPVP